MVKFNLNSVEEVGMRFLFNSYERLSRRQFSIIFAATTFGGAFSMALLPKLLPKTAGGEGIMVLLALLVSIVIVSLMSSAKRLNDAGISSGFAIVAMIPWIGFFFMLWLCFIKTEEPNQHGLQEPW